MESDENSPHGSPSYSPTSPSYSPNSPSDHYRQFSSRSPPIERVPPKRCRKEAEEDRLSNLPKSIILLILSLLTTNQSIQTTVLSKRWRSFWPFVPVLDFRFRDSNRYRKACCMESFVSFVNHVLIFYQSVKVDAFRVCMEYTRSFAHDVDVRLLFAIRKCVGEVEIDFADDDDERNPYNAFDCYPVPFFMFINASLVRLKLTGCEIKYRGAVNWKSLKVLTLSEIGLGNDLIRIILSGSPSLEVLELLDCSDYDIVNIKNERLRRFVINSYSKYLDRDKHIEIKILAPFIQSLEISGTLKAHKVLLINCSSLVEAKINFDEVVDPDEEDDKEFEKNLREILGKLHHVRNLTVGNNCLQALTRMMAHDVSLQALSCKCLTLLTQLDTWNGIAILLRSSPLLQTLHINLHDNYYWGGYFDEDCLLTLEKELALKTLKLITVSGLVQRFNYYKRFIPVAKFLLKNATVLEKMVIITPQKVKVNTWPYSENDKSRELLVDLTFNLLALPRSSLNAVIERS